MHPSTPAGEVKACTSAAPARCWARQKSCFTCAKRGVAACRALRVMRLSLLAGELNGMHLSSSGALLSGAASIRLLQLVASVLTLLFTTSSIVHLVERIPFHDALYFVTTTLTTVRGRVSPHCVTITLTTVRVRFCKCQPLLLLHTHSIACLGYMVYGLHCAVPLASRYTGVRPGCVACLLAAAS